LTQVIGSPRQIRDQTKRYVRENWGFPFIVAFILLLLLAAIFLAISNYYTSITTLVWAEAIASCAYIVLVVGVVLQLGKINSNSARKYITQIKEFKIISKCIHFGKNWFKKGAVFHGSD
jgi:hypothetical protein